jgi:hypothetical protein
MTNTHEPLINVALLLSSEEKPKPDKEVIELYDICQRDGEVSFAVTRNISHLDRGSEVVFLAYDQEMLSVLATAQFVEFVDVNSDAGRSLLEKGAYYHDRHPRRLRGFSRLNHFCLCADSMRLDDLNGWLGNGCRLTTAALALKRKPASIYYVKAPESDGISDSIRCRLLEAKCEELEDKYIHTRELWEQDIERARKRADDVIKAADAGYRKFSGGRKELNKVLKSAYEVLLPSIDFLRDSIDVMHTQMRDSKSLLKALKRLNQDPELRNGLRNGKAVAGARGWFRVRLVDNLGRLYYRSAKNGYETRVEILISQKDEQKLDIKYIRNK